MPRITEYSSMQDRADASIWEHCCHIFRSLGGHDVREMLAELGCCLLSLGFLILCVLTMPISFPLIAYFRRRSVRREIDEWRKQHDGCTCFEQQHGDNK